MTDPYVRELALKRALDKENAVRKLLGLPELHSQEEAEAAAAEITEEYRDHARKILSQWEFVNYSDGQWDLVKKDELK